MNYRIVDGRLTRNAEVKINKNNGKQFLSFTLANNGFSRGEQVTTFFNVISYNDYDINRLENFTQGKLVVVTGRPDEVLTIKDNKTYLNRNINAYSIETGTPNIVRDNNGATYRDSAPSSTNSQVANAPTCEVPRMETPQVQVPKVPEPQPVPKYEYTSQISSGIGTSIKSSEQLGMSSDDDLPF